MLGKRGVWATQFFYMQPHLFVARTQYIAKQKKIAIKLMLFQTCAFVLHETMHAEQVKP